MKGGGGEEIVTLYRLVVLGLLDVINILWKTKTLKSLIFQDAEDEYLISCLMMVFVAVSIPKLARSESSQYKVTSQLGGLLI